MMVSSNERWWRPKEVIGFMIGFYQLMVDSVTTACVSDEKKKTNKNDLIWVWWYIPVIPSPGPGCKKMGARPSCDVWDFNTNKHWSNWVVSIHYPSVLNHPCLPWDDMYTETCCRNDHIPTVCWLIKWLNEREEEKYRKGLRVRVLELKETVSFTILPARPVTGFHKK